jgi:hypothetical protein
LYQASIHSKIAEASSSCVVQRWVSSSSRGADVVGDRPAHDRAAKYVEHGAAVDLPGAGGVLGDAGAPEPVRTVGDEALHQVLVRGRHRPLTAFAASVAADPGPADEATILRLLRDDGLILPAEYQRERRKLAERRKAAFATETTGPNQVWQLDFSEFETTAGTWRPAGCRDYWSKYEHPFQVSLTANQHDAIDAIELALADYDAIFGHPPADECKIGPDTGELLPMVTIVTDNGGPFCSFRFEGFIELHPELHHVEPGCAHPGRTAHANAASAP